MGTKGYWGIYKNGVCKYTYSHYDATPSNLGVAVLDFIKNCNNLEQKFNEIQMVNEEDLVNKEQIIFTLDSILKSLSKTKSSSLPMVKRTLENEYSKYIKITPNNEIILLKEDDIKLRWYDLLNGLVYSSLPYIYIEDFNIMTQCTCWNGMWGYIINLDDNSLDIHTDWNSFNKVISTEIPHKIYKGNQSFIDYFRSFNLSKVKTMSSSEFYLKCNKYI